MDWIESTHNQSTMFWHQKTYEFVPLIHVQLRSHPVTIPLWLAQKMNQHCTPDYQSGYVQHQHVNEILQNGKRKSCSLSLLFSSRSYQMAPNRAAPGATALELESREAWDMVDADLLRLVLQPVPPLITSYLSGYRKPNELCCCWAHQQHKHPLQLEGCRKTNTKAEEHASIPRPIV